MEEKILFTKSRIHKQNERYLFIDYLRITCSFFVVLIHVSGNYLNKLRANSYKWKIAYFFNGLSRFCVPNFFMISGALFLGKEISFTTIIFKYIKRIILCFLIWSAIYSLFDLKLSEISLKKLFYTIIKGHYHLWYLYTTCGLYIKVPFTREIIKNKKLFNYLIFFNFLFIFAIPNYIYILNYYSITFAELLNYINSMLNLNTFSVFNFYFVFGYFLNTKKEIKKESSIAILKNYNYYKFIIVFINLKIIDST